MLRIVAAATMYLLRFHRIGLFLNLMETILVCLFQNQTTIKCATVHRGEKYLYTCR